MRHLQEGASLRLHGLGHRPCLVIKHGLLATTKFNQIPKGARVKITYAGKQKVGKGMAKMFDVEVDDDVELLDPDTAPESDREPGSDDGDETPFH